MIICILRADGVLPYAAVIMEAGGSNNLPAKCFNIGMFSPLLFSTSWWGESTLAPTPAFTPDRTSIT